MKFSQRLAYYLLGLLIGGVIVMFFFDSKGTQFCYLPNCRVLKELRSKPLTMTKEAEQDLKTYTMDDVIKCLTYGDVDFSKSNIPEENGKLYWIEGKDENNNPIVVQMINYQDKVLLKRIETLQKN